MKEQLKSIIEIYYLFSPFKGSRKRMKLFLHQMGFRNNSQTTNFQHNRLNNLGPIFIPEKKLVEVDKP